MKLIIELLIIAILFLILGITGRWVLITDQIWKRMSKETKPNKMVQIPQNEYEKLLEGLPNEKQPD